jgi:hypothetical protein
VDINGPPFRSAGIAGIGLCARTCHPGLPAATQFRRAARAVRSLHDRAAAASMTGYAPGHWTGFAAAVAGSTASLAGLLFVAVSINVRQILKYPSLPSRAGQTLLLFATPLVAAVFVLVPGQPVDALAGELIGTGVVIGGYQLWIDHRSERAEQETPLTWIIAWVFPAVVSCGCLVVAGATLLAGGGGGLYWIVPGVVAAIVFGLANAWVLLIEILR